MRIQYRFHQLSIYDIRLYELILVEELDVQSWFAVRCSGILGEEICLAVQ